MRHNMPAGKEVASTSGRHACGLKVNEKGAQIFRYRRCPFDAIFVVSPRADIYSF